MLERPQLIGNIREYAEKLLGENLIPIRARKVGLVQARKGIVGEEVVTYASDGTLETKDTVKLDEDGDPDWVITKPGLSNSWLISPKAFAATYILLDDAQGLYRPVGEIRTFLPLAEDVSFLTRRGAIMNVRSGGYLNITDLNKIVGISKKDFDMDYEIVGEDEEGACL